MWRNLAKIVVILLLCGSSEARPQKTGESATTKPIGDQRKPALSFTTAANVQDSRYTWNSGSSRVPYIHFYHDSVNHSFTGAEVSVDRSTGSKSLSPFNYQAASRGIKESKSLSNDSTSGGKPIRANHRMLKIFHGKDRNDLPQSRNFFRRIEGSVLRNFTSKSDHDRSLSSKIPRFDGSTEIGLNNSPKGVAWVRDPGFSVVSAVNRVKADPSVEFDHVAAIRKITDMLTQQSAGTASSKVAIDPVSQSVSPPRVSNVSNRHSSSKYSNTKNRTKTRPPSTQNKKVPSKSKIRNKTNSSRPVYWKNWPNGDIQTANDYQNYEKYTSSMEDSKPEEIVQKPVPQTVPQMISHMVPLQIPLQVPQMTNGVNHRVPISSPDLQEIVHWLKIPAFMPNGSHILESNESNDPVSVVFDPVYQNLEPNRPLRPTNLQGFRPGLIYTPSPQPVYTTEKPSGWLGNMFLKNKTQSGPQNQLGQDALVHIVNSDSKKPIVGTKRPANYGRPPVPGSSGSTGFEGTESYQLGPSTTTQKPGPNVHIGFTSYEEKDKVPNKIKPQPPLVTYDQRCPTILINSYTRINNTVQSKEGCTDLNIIINSHVFNTNTYKSTPSPLGQVDQSYGSIDKYGSGPAYQPESESNYYGPLKDPVTSASDDIEGSNLQVYHGTHISILGSGPGSEAQAVEPAEQVNELSNDPDTFDASPAAEEVPDPNDVSGLNSAIQSEADPVDSENSGSSLPSSLTPTSSPALDDDEEDDLDLSPTGIMESLASVFAYFTYVNPLHYGLFSIAAAPFTALAAGVLGMVTFFFPWLFPSSFGFRRANNDAVGFWHNVEDVIRQSMEKYGRLNEWKSRRKKRKR